jgi:superfamily II DNA or RNA helicase
MLDRRRPITQPQPLKTPPSTIRAIPFPEMDGSVAELGRQLLGSGDGELLDVPLDALGERVGSEEARSLFGALHESGAAHSMRDALSDDRLARWVEDTCTESEERAILLQLRRWLGHGALGDEAGPDDPARLVALPPLPHNPEALVSWARQHDVVGELMRPIAEVIALGPLPPLELSVLEACCPDFAAEGGRRPSELTWLQKRAQTYLRGQAAEASALAAREVLWQSVLPIGPLRLLAERLRALLTPGAPASLHGLRFAPGRPVTIDADTGVCRGVLRNEASGVSVQLLLSGYEHRALEGTCESCAQPSCIHVATLAGRVIDACVQPQDRLHQALAAFTRVPSWRRFVDALASDPQPQAARAALHFVLRLDAARVAVGVFKDGLDASKLASPLRLLRSGQVEERDRAVLETLAGRTRTLGAHWVYADLNVLRSLVEHPRVLSESTGEALHLSEEQLALELLERPEGMQPRVTLAGAPVTSHARDPFVFHHDAARRALVFAVVHPPLQRLLAALEHFRGILPKESYPALASRLSALRSIARVQAPKALDGYEHPAADKLLLRITPLLEEGLDLTLCVRVFPLSPLWIPGEGSERVDGLVDGEQRFSRRNLSRERELAEQVIDALSLRQYTEITRCAYRINSHAAALEVLSRAAQLHERLDLEWAETERRLHVTGTVRSADLHVRLFKRGAWLVVSGAAGSGAEQVAIARLLQAVRLGERFVQVQGRDYVEIERSLFALLEEAQLGVSSHDRQLALPLAAAPYVLPRLGEQVRGGDVETEAWLTRLAQRSQPTAADETLPLYDRLRSYQRAGVQWLLALAAWAPGAVLADEMGLGKTVQAIALLLQRAAAGPALVIAPTTLVANWQNELARFAPQLRVLVYRGSERQRLLAELAPSTVLITSYEILLRDREHFSPHAFATQIIDEAQNLRNARTARARAVAEVQAEFRVALTGTPIENRLGDLWSLFQLIAPGLLGHWSRFRALFAVPIERYDDRERATRLRNLVGPFLLRRTKDDVAPELPARTEVVHTVELSGPEQQLYRAALAHARLALSSRQRRDGEFTVHILAELTRLRQLACHPRLVLPDSRIESTKLHVLQRLLDDILPRGHRVLVFSQFAKHLGLVRDALCERGRSVLYLDGSTPSGERAELVERFQAGAAEVFLISLKAGGTGLNLTAADYVVHMDPWWNPAAEDQASDRAHRIGQTRPVTIVKLVAADTIEERVLGLHAHKRRLAQDMLSGEPSGAALDQEALQALLAE